MAKHKKGQKLLCVPCGRRVVIDACGASETTIWCCGRPMQKKAKAKLKKTKKAKKTHKKK
ncbi:MAG: hypothetical protein PHI60_08755 [Candidatus Omnitrophica bacterium]|nr:hypothetical protein [Candidatus Omnitrophota bacterium]